MFPGPNAQVYRNEAGEPIGWDYPSDDGDASAYYCDMCGFSHIGSCPDDSDEDEESSPYCYRCEDLVYKEGLCAACLDKENNGTS